MFFPFPSYGPRTSLTLSTSMTHPFRRITEVSTDRPPALVHAEWRARFPWLVQGTTVRGGEAEPFDLGLFSDGSSERDVRARWADFAAVTGAETVAHSRQIHEATVRLHDGSRIESEAEGVRGVPRLHLVEECDGHATAVPGVVLAVTVADCVPVFIVDARRRAVAAVHAGWRGAALGVLEQGLETMARAFGSRPADVDVHLGPSICAECYEVGPEVFDALGQAVPHGPTPIDLRRILGERATHAGVGVDRITVSTHCTRCTGSGLFSHRGGEAHRQVGYVGVRGGPAGSSPGDRGPVTRDPQGQTE